MITDVKKIDIGWSLRYHKRRDYLPVLKWCRLNLCENGDDGKECPWHDKIPFSYEFHNEYIYFTFGRKSDLMMFILRWA